MKAARKNLSAKDEFESVYLYVKQLQNAITPKSEQFLKNEIKIIKYSSRIFYKKHYKGLKSLGFEIEDIVSIVKCYALIFHYKFLPRLKTKSKKYKSYCLMRFLGHSLIKVYTRINKKLFLRMNSLIDAELTIGNLESQYALNFTGGKSSVDPEIWIRERKEEIGHKITQRIERINESEKTKLLSFAIRKISKANYKYAPEIELARTIIRQIMPYYPLDKVIAEKEKK